MSIPTPGERAALPGAAAQSRKAGSLRRLSLDVLKHARLRALLALIFLLLGSLTEWGALLLLIPVLQLGAFRGETVTLHTPARLADRLGPVIHLTAEELPLGRSSSPPATDGPRSDADSAGDGNRAAPPQHIEPDARTLEDVERSHILLVLERTQGVIEGPRGAAKILNLHPNTLRSRMKKLGVR